VLFWRPESAAHRVDIQVSSPELLPTFYGRFPGFGVSFSVGQTHFQPKTVFSRTAWSTSLFQKAVEQFQSWLSVSRITIIRHPTITKVRSTA